MRRRALALVLLLAGCGSSQPPPPTTFAPLDYSYLTRLRLTVGSIDVADAPPRSRPGEVGQLAPIPPRTALQRMAQDRLEAAGGQGRAVFSIEDASIVQSRGSYQGNFAVRLEVTPSDGQPGGFAQAQVARTRSVQNDSAAGVRAELYDMVKQMMTDMNVEFEYQVKRALKDRLQVLPTGGGAAPAAVEKQDLAAPPARPVP